MSLNTAAVAAAAAKRAGASGMKKMTASAPIAQDAEAALANRRSLNANRRTAPRQDLSGASPGGTIVGRGGNTQQLGKAAMSRLPPQESAPRTQIGTQGPGDGMAPGGAPAKPAWQVMREQGIAGQGSAAANKALAGNPQEMAIKSFAAKNPGLSEDFIRNAAGGGPPGGMPGGMPGGAPGGPPQAEMIAKLQGAGAPGGAAPMGGAIGGPPQPGGGGGFNPGLQPNLMARLSALRGGAGQPPGAPGGGGPFSPEAMANFKQNTAGMSPEQIQPQMASTPGAPGGGPAAGVAGAMGAPPGVTPMPGQGQQAPGLESYFQNMQRGLGGGQVYY